MSAQCEDDQAIKTMGRNRLSFYVTVWVIFVRRLDRNFESIDHNDFLHYPSTCQSTDAIDLLQSSRTTRMSHSHVCSGRWIRLEWEGCTCLMRNQGGWHPRPYLAHGSCPGRVDRF